MKWTRRQISSMGWHKRLDAAATLLEQTGQLVGPVQAPREGGDQSIRGLVQEDIRSKAERGAHSLGEFRLRIGDLLGHGYSASVHHGTSGSLQYREHLQRTGLKGDQSAHVQGM